MDINIGTNIKRLRIAKNITQEQLSEAMNVTCAAVSKWERGETYPDITLLQPLAYYFGVTLDELMGYNKEKVQAKIDEVIALYKKHWNSDCQKAREIIVKAHHDFPNDYQIMHYYMWNIAGDMADNDPSILLAHKEEFIAICDKILNGCTEEMIRLNAWNMRAKILYAEGRTEDALEIYKAKYPNWFHTCGQKSEQLFEKGTDEYYYWVQRNMYDLIDFAADKLGRVVFFDKTLSMKEKAERTLKYADLVLSVFNENNDAFFVLFVYSFLGRMRNDIVNFGGSDEDIISVMDKYLYATKKLTECMNENETLRKVYMLNHTSVTKDNLLEWIVEYYLNAKQGRCAKLLKNSEYIEVLNKYR